jgi:hypothetical protein
MSADRVRCSARQFSSPGQEATLVARAVWAQFTPTRDARGLGRLAIASHLEEMGAHGQRMMIARRCRRPHAS